MTEEKLNYLFSVVQNVFSFTIYVFQFRVFRVFRGKNVFYFSYFCFSFKHESFSCSLRAGRPSDGQMMQ